MVPQHFMHPRVPSKALKAVTISITLDSSKSSISLKTGPNQYFLQGTLFILVGPLDDETTMFEMVGPILTRVSFGKIFTAMNHNPGYLLSLMMPEINSYLLWSDTLTYFPSSERYRDKVFYQIRGIYFVLLLF